MPSPTGHVRKTHNIGTVDRIALTSKSVPLFDMLIKMAIIDMVIMAAMAIIAYWPYLLL